MMEFGDALQDLTSCLNQFTARDQLIFFLSMRDQLNSIFSSSSAEVEFIAEVHLKVEHLDPVEAALKVARLRMLDWFLSGSRLWRSPPFLSFS